MKDKLSCILPEQIKAVLAPVYRQSKKGIKYIPAKTYALADRYEVIDPDQIYNEDYYLKRKRDPYKSDARIVSKVIYDEFAPRSVIDFGCAIGSHLRYFYNSGVEIYGVDGSEQAIENAVIPQEYLSKHDLRYEFEAAKKYDLVLCFETAEHIPRKFDDNLISSLTNAGDTVVFTAAPLGQPGKHHVNLQPRSYWKEKFRSQGMSYKPRIVDNLRSQMEVNHTDWIPNNLFVFKQDDL